MSAQANEEAQRRADRRERRLYVLILVVFTLILGGAAAWFAAYAPRPITNALPAWLIAGLVVFMLVLTLAVVVYKSLGIADSKQALGLPEGSIRAIIALLLILLFFLVAFNLFGYLRNIQTSTIHNLTQEQVAAIPGSDIESIVPSVDNPANFDVERITGPTPAAQDFAKQLLTTLSTLVVAIAAFYFGSSSTAQASREAYVAGASGAGGGEATKPSLRIIEPTSPTTVLIRTPNGEFAPETIRAETTPAGQPIETKIDGDTETSVVKVTESEFRYTPANPTKPEITITLKLVNHPEVAQQRTFLKEPSKTEVPESKS